MLINALLIFSGISLESTLKPHYNKIVSYPKISSLYAKIHYKGIFLTLYLLQDYPIDFVVNILLYLGSFIEVSVYYRNIKNY